ncbi:OprO/OprP family phosphate-selective porin [Marilutibacter chinensis]|uniref:OprO/OprP family phosphate-selective porin n=1 Tax=Marilutibacter chinensis TaxID=2912247 RepID=A0ABS9HVT4_9GAMM|nr:OprO/OprP family phosphate-selective porin [Lysobacter chinensis]MCF7222626.1 OprO/OprP family phosphate-selective porin [Lysobacter chinensis]
MKLIPAPLALAILAIAPAAHAEVAIDVIGGSEMSFEGLLQTDGYWYDNDVANLDADSGDGDDTDFGLRRAELVLKGKGPGNIDWVLGYDASGDGKFLDANVRYRIAGSKTHFVQVGQFKQPNSLEELSSTKNNDFISKAMITNTFGVARRLGASYNVGNDDWQVTASYFGRELTRNRAHGSGFGLRGGWAPINEKGNIFYVGASYVDYDADGDTIRLRARPDADFSNRLIDTGSTGILNADRTSTIGLESFWVRGPFKLQAEYMMNTVDRYDTGFATQPGGDYDSSGGYISGVWNVTGETWSNKGGVPGTSGAENPASGMWQLGLRYDTLDLDDGIVQGGQMDTWTVGVNYYWRSNFKFMVDYVKVDSERRGVDDNPNIIEARAQFFW